MGGCWVTWSAEIAVRQDVLDIRPYLTQGVAALRAHRDVADAYCEFHPWTATVRFAVLVRHGITEVIAKRQAADALHNMLPRAGLATQRSRWVNGAPMAWLHFTWWPSDFMWW